jgi:hypothetical protein
MSTLTLCAVHDERAVAAMLGAEMRRLGIVGRGTAHWEHQGEWWCWTFRIYPKADPSRFFKAGEQMGHRSVEDQARWAAETCKETMGRPGFWGQYGYGSYETLNSGYGWSPSLDRQQQKQTVRVH